MDESASAEAFNRLAIERLLPRVNEMGIRLIELRRGYAVARAPMEGNSNHLGTMYAGTLFAVAEVLGGAIVVATFDVAKVYPVVKSLKIDYRRPARDAVTAKASMSEAQIAELSAAAEAAGRAQFKLTAQLFDTSGELVAETEGDYQIRAHGT